MSSEYTRTFIRSLLGTCISGTFPHERATEYRSGMARSAGHIAVGIRRAGPNQCKASLHELEQAKRALRPPRLSSWQSQRSTDPGPRSALIAQKGHAGFTFAEAARLGRRESSGTLSAFYRPRRASCQCGPARLRAIRGGAGQRMERRPPGCFRGTLKASERPFSAICESEPAYYSAMFEAGRSARIAPPHCAKRASVAFAVLRQSNRSSSLPPCRPRDRPPSLMVALHIWAMLHGIASLFSRGDAASRVLPMSAEDLLEAAVLVYLRGLERPRAGGKLS